MFIAAPFTIGRMWEQPKCPTTDAWIKKMWCVYIYRTQLQKEKKRVICTDVDGPRVCYTERSKSEREK